MRIGGPGLLVATIGPPGQRFVILGGACGVDNAARPIRPCAVLAGASASVGRIFRCVAYRGAG